jgi:DNA-binding NarL/FixJ family response regulator
MSADEFEFQLDLARAAAHTAVIESDGRIRVLIADDEAAHRVAVKRILERTGRFTVVAEAGDGQQAVQLAARERPDLVLLDLTMPKMNGLEALPRILSRSPGTKVALLSAHLGVGPLAPGASLQLFKGLKPEQMVADLLLLMGRRPPPDL